MNESAIIGTLACVVLVQSLIFIVVATMAIRYYHLYRRENYFLKLVHSDYKSMETNKNHFCDGINRIARLVFEPPHKDCYAPSAVARRVEEIVTAWKLLKDILPDGTGVNAILRERTYQLAKWGNDHDDRHTLGELSDAARCYAEWVLSRIKFGEGSVAPDKWARAMGYWPWSEPFEPSKDPLKNLAIAGALVAAEYDRLARLDAKEIMGDVSFKVSEPNADGVSRLVVSTPPESSLSRDVEAPEHAMDRTPSDTGMNDSGIAPEPPFVEDVRSDHKETHAIDVDNLDECRALVEHGGPAYIDCDGKDPQAVQVMVEIGYSKPGFYFATRADSIVVSSNAAHSQYKHRLHGPYGTFPEASIYKAQHEAGMLALGE